MIIAIYINDILLAGITITIDFIKKMLMDKFKCKEFGFCRYLLGMEIKQYNNISIIMS